MRQTLSAGRMMNMSEQQIKQMMDTVGQGLSSMDLDQSPPELTRLLQDTINRTSGSADPYKELKRLSNEVALTYLEKMRDLVKNSEDRLKTALSVAIAGNIIDYGAIGDLDIEKELSVLMSEERTRIANEDERLFELTHFKEDLLKAKRILYVGDNCGECAFDTILLEQLRETNSELEITYLTRGKPILNDCLVEDAREVGIGKYATILSSGSDVPGLVLSRCTAECRELFENADLIISKGQGNFEALSGTTAPVYFLLITKCQVIADEIGCEVRDIILKRA